MSAKPALSPSFKSTVGDYVSHCRKGRPLRLSIVTPPGGKVSVDGAKSKSGSFTATVPLHVGQSTELAFRSPGHKHRYHLRCLSSPFPGWKFHRYSRPQAQWYLFAPVDEKAVDASRTRYVIIFDSNGVPVWWRRTTDVPFNSILLPDGTIAWTHWFGTPFGMSDRVHWDINPIDGTKRIRTLRTIGSPPDTHDMEPLPNGNYLLITYRVRRKVDLSPCGGPAKADVVDGEIQELSPRGKRVWSWNSKGHIGLCETQDLPSHKKDLEDGTIVYDLMHLNSVERDGDGLVISSRNTNAVYRIDRASGNVTWKLGGTHRPESLTVMNDPLSPTFGQQHDARVLSDGTVTVYDNRTFRGAPRAVRFSIDATNKTAKTATLIEQITDPLATDSKSEGSARRLPGGDWVVTWGQTPLVTETSASNQPVFRLSLDRAINYRTQPIPYGTLKAATLRRAMDRRFPRLPAH